MLELLLQNCAPRFCPIAQSPIETLRRVRHSQREQDHELYLLEQGKKQSWAIARRESIVELEDLFYLEIHHLRELLCIDELTLVRQS